MDSGATSASMVSIMTALWFAHLEAGGRVSVKPHAAPVLHAINHLLGNLDRGFLTELRAYGGLQSYPSRTKDPFPVDYSTGSVGIGATAPIWVAIARRYVSSHFRGQPTYAPNQASSCSLSILNTDGWWARSGIAPSRAAGTVSRSTT